MGTVPIHDAPVFNVYTPLSGPSLARASGHAAAGHTRDIAATGMTRTFKTHFIPVPLPMPPPSAPTPAFARDPRLGLGRLSADYCRFYACHSPPQLQPQPEHLSALTDTEVASTHGRRRLPPPPPHCGPRTTSFDGTFRTRPLLDTKTTGCAVSSATASSSCSQIGPSSELASSVSSSRATSAAFFPVDNLPLSPNISRSCATLSLPYPPSPGGCCRCADRCGCW